MELFNQDVMKKRGLRRAFFFIAARLANYINYDCFRRKRIGMCHLVWAMEYEHPQQQNNNNNAWNKNKERKRNKKRPRNTF